MLKSTGMEYFELLIQDEYKDPLVRDLARRICSSYFQTEIETELDRERYRG